MLELVIAADLAVKGTRAVAWSALPDAPVVEPPPERMALRLRTRATLASRLHRIATTLEPRRPDRASTACS